MTAFGKNLFLIFGAKSGQGALERGFSSYMKNQHFFIFYANTVTYRPSIDLIELFSGKI